MHTTYYNQQNGKQLIAFTLYRYYVNKCSESRGYTGGPVLIIMPSHLLCIFFLDCGGNNLSQIPEDSVKHIEQTKFNYYEFQITQNLIRKCLGPISKLQCDALGTARKYIIGIKLNLISYISCFQNITPFCSNIIWNRTFLSLSHYLTDNYLHKCCKGKEKHLFKNINIYRSTFLTVYPPMILHSISEAQLYILNLCPV